MNCKMIIWALVFVLFSSCKKDSKAPEPTDPGTETPEPGTQKREVLVWVDANSNVFGTYGRFSDKKEISAVLDTLKDAGVTALVVDVKGSSGYTMYPSNYTREMTTRDGKTRLSDYVPFVISEAKKRGLKVYLSMVTFVDGDRRGFGYVYDNPEYRSKYESIVVKNTTGTLGPISETGKNVFVNPAAAEVQEKALNIIKEIVGKFDLDGMILDYGRYTDISADFSPLSKQQFITFLETKYNDAQAKNMRFPEDIVATWRESSGQILPATTGKYYKQWLIYRAQVIKDFMGKARAATKSVKPNVEFGVYVGAWYTTYYQVGVNWASKEYDPFQDFEVRFDWASPGYGATGYAEELDILMTGNYFTQIKLADNPVTAGLKYHWWSIEGSLNGISHITKNKVPVYGSIDVGNVSYANKGEITKAIKYILSRTSGGIMLFDVVHMYAPQYNQLKQPLFDAVKAGIKN
ncbi:alpha amylase family protein [Sphingobacterium psychroaquaticum]|uniref:Glycosyl hydrolase-like 10 n=1 Tax=Sphingobacterium psychroaquaticum TaxID=561061 RepID=A0A1X7KHU4_9SPHI|nr:alpha amylase family protein [Sphingobacterium psychroaquaticum]SMG40588.1 Glycosyl hydrolase-like 10 [Sphingobacterium psychroaquaticum]